MDHRFAMERAGPRRTGRIPSWRFCLVSRACEKGARFPDRLRDCLALPAIPANYPLPARERVRVRGENRDAETSSA